MNTEANGAVLCELRLELCILTREPGILRLELGRAHAAGKVSETVILLAQLLNASHDTMRDRDRVNAPTDGSRRLAAHHNSRYEDVNLFLQAADNRRRFRLGRELVSERGIKAGTPRKHIRVHLLDI